MSLSLKQLNTTTAYRVYTLGEEIVHAVTHGIGAGLSVAGLTLLVVLATLFGNVYQIVSFSIYGTTLIILYLASTLYHSFQHPPVKHIFKIIDHAAIFLLIAGTYTPFLLIGVRGTLGWTVLVIIWLLAIVGVCLKTIFVNRFDKVSLAAYILMGWLSVVVLRDLLLNVPIEGLIWLVVGGGFYTIGTIFYSLQKIRYTHAIWHVFVLGGSLCHYLAVLFYLTPSY